MAAVRSLRMFALGLGIAVVATSGAFAGDPPSKPKDDPSKRICKVQTPTGSRFTRRVCKTAQEWQKDEDFAQTRIEESRLPPPPDPSFSKPQ